MQLLLILLMGLPPEVFPPMCLSLAKQEVKGADASVAIKGQRNAFFRKYNDYIATNIYDYDKLQAGNIVEGPAIIEAEDTTVVITPEQKGYVDQYLNIKIEV